MYATFEHAVHSARKLYWVVGSLTTIGACGIYQPDQIVETRPTDSSVCAASVASVASLETRLDTPDSASGVVSVPDQAPVCPEGMLVVDGDFCTNPEHTCLEWMEDPFKYQFARCLRYSEPATCKGERIKLRFCIDKYEAAEDSGLPIGNISWTQASAACETAGKRLCKEQEWLFACEGEAMLPYPYGFVRNPAVCNFELTEGLATKTGELADHRRPVSANPECLSPFGVVNMVGNIDEWVVLDKPHYSMANGGRRMMSGLKGGWWGPLRNRCRPTTVDHDEFFHELQTGFRCCSDLG